MTKLSQTGLRNELKTELGVKAISPDLLAKARQIKLIFFDIDDTLRLKEPAFMPASVNQAFAKLREKGILTGIATGRNLYGVVPEVRALEPDFFVTINGAYVENAQHEALYRHPFSKELVKEIIDWLKREKSEFAFVGAHELRVSRWTEIAEKAISPVYQTLTEEENFYLTHEVYQMLTISDHDDKLQLPPALADKIRLVRWHENNSDVVPLTGSKAEGCKKVIEQLGLRAENVMNFGDELNDRELFDWAGLSVAMEISHPEILAKADYVTDKVENDGIYKALEALQII